jgi:hypothetical protein
MLNAYCMTQKEALGKTPDFEKAGSLADKIPQPSDRPREV